MSDPDCGTMLRFVESSDQSSAHWVLPGSLAVKGLSMESSTDVPAVVHVVEALLLKN